MKKIEFYLWSVLFFPILSGCSDFSDRELVGSYMNVNYGYTPFVPEIPYVNDTLVLKDDFTFQSRHFGSGNYELNRSFFETEIVLHYEYGMGKALYKAKIEPDEGANPKIILFREKNHYYKKVE